MLKQICTKILNKIKIFKKFILNPQYYKWVKDEGDNKLQLNYELDEKSIFFELGGFDGTYTKLILQKFNPQSYIFEPSEKYFKILNNTIKKNNVKIYNFGLSNENKQAFLNHKEDQSYIGDNKIIKGEKVELKKLSEFVKKENIPKIDLININIEGSEYEVLDEIINSGLINNIDNLQIQFHKNIKNYRIKRKNIINRLSNTHNLLWSYKFVWERWEIKNLS